VRLFQYSSSYGSALNDEDQHENSVLGSKYVRNTENLDYIRKEKIKEKKLKEVVKNVIFQGMFLWILFVTAFSNRDLNCFRYQNSLKNLADTDSINSVIFLYFRFGFLTLYSNFNPILKDPNNKSVLALHEK
jgi:hypothetical protein